MSEHRDSSGNLHVTGEQVKVRACVRRLGALGFFEWKSFVVVIGEVGAGERNESVKNAYFDQYGAQWETNAVEVQP